MTEIELTIPESIPASLPADGDDARRDMARAVEGWQRQLNEALAAAEGEAEVVALLERFEDRWAAYDEFVVELRAWGQSPVYAMAWRNLLAAVVRQVHDHGDLGERLNRERHARIFDEGIRPD